MIRLPFRDKNEKSQEGYYITDTFERRECVKFVPQSSDNLIRCKCGQISEDHGPTTNWEFGGSCDVPWSPESDTKCFPTNAYGEINFMGVDNDVLPAYVRCKMDTDVALLADLLIKKWCLQTPNMILSVFGGHAKFDINTIGSKNMEEIRNGLVKAAQSTRAWFFTSGINKGVSNLVGDAVASKRSFIKIIPVIGINCWGAVKNNWNLVHDMGLFPAHYYFQDPDEASHSASTVGYMALEHEHTHFILLDKGTRYNFHENEVRQFRIKFQQYIAQKTDAHLMSVMIEGGVGSLYEARMRLQAGLPILVLGGSGRISDVICLAYSLSTVKVTTDGQDTRTSRDLINEEGKHKILSQLSQAIPNKTQEEYLELYGVIEDILTYENLVSIWDPNEDDDLDKAILRGLISILKHQTSDELEIQKGDTVSKNETLNKLVRKQLELAVKWDRLDIANEHIFLHEAFTEASLNEMLWIAITHKRTSFAKALISRGANLRSLLTEGRFEMMLNNMPQDTYFHTLMCRDNGNSRLTYDRFREVVEGISDGVYECPSRNIYGEKMRIKSRRSLLDRLRNSFRPRSDVEQGTTQRFVIINDDCTSSEKDKLQQDKKRSFQKYDFEMPENILVMFYTLLHEFDMAMLFWEYSSTPLFMALVSRHLHLWLASKEKSSVEITVELKSRLIEFADKLEVVAVALLDEASSNYPRNLVLEFITHEYIEWGNLTVLDLADFSEAQHVVAHSSVQDYIEAKWKGHLDPDISSYRIFFSIFCPFLASLDYTIPISGESDKNMDASERLKTTTLERRKSFVKGQILLKEEPQVEKKASWWFKLKEFYKTPVTKFYIYMMTYMAFMICFVFALLLKQKGDIEYCEKTRFNIQKLFGCRFSRTETLVYIWVLALLPLEIRQVYFASPKTLLGKVRLYLSDTYNKNDLLCYVLMLLAFICKYPKPQNSDEYVEYDSAYRFLFSLAFVFYCARMCQAMQIDKRMGPKVLMMHQMLIDLVFFILLVAMFLVGYGVSSAAIMNPLKHESLTPTLLFDIFWRPYVNLFGEFGDDDMVEYMSGKFCEYRKHHNASYGAYGLEDGIQCEEYSCEEDSICNVSQYFVKIFLAVYMMLAAVLMLNLLVAVFSSTYDNLQNLSGVLWKWQRFDLMKEFSERSAIPIPFSSILYTGKFIVLVVKKASLCCRTLCGSERKVVDTSMMERLSTEHSRVKFLLLESECRRNYLDKQGASSFDDYLQLTLKTLEKKVQEVNERVSEFENSIQSVLDANLGTDDGGIKEAACPLSRSSPQELELLEVLDVDGNDLEVEVGSMNIDMAELGVEGSSSGSKPSKSLLVTKPLDYAKLQSMGSRSRTPEYPESAVRRVFVKKEHWDWRHPLVKYNPSYLQFSSLSSPSEPKLSEIHWNDCVDEDERRSYEGRYLTQNKLPLNPIGRTGISGKGKLDRWGPNFISIPIISRFYSKSTGDGDHPFEVLMCKDSKDILHLPEIACRRDNGFPDEIKQIFETTHLGLEEKSRVSKRIDKIIKNGIVISRGYYDSEYNTDNSWLESLVTSFHDVSNKVFNSVGLDSNSKYEWYKIEKDTRLYQEHMKYFQKTMFARNQYD